MLIVVSSHPELRARGSTRTKHEARAAAEARGGSLERYAAGAEGGRERCVDLASLSTLRSSLNVTMASSSDMLEAFVLRGAGDEPLEV